MKLYIRSRFSAATLCFYCALGILLVATGDVNIYMPNFVTAISQEIPVPVIVACTVSIVSVSSLRSGYPLFEAQSRRRIPALDLSVIAVITTIFFTIALLALGWEPAVMVLRALIGFSASALTVATILGDDIGVLTPGILFIVFTLFGAQPNGGADAWAFAIADYDAVFSWILVTIIGISGIFSWICRFPSERK